MIILMDDKLSQLITNYQPSQATRELLKQHPIVLFAGIASAGKDTIQQKLLTTGQFMKLVTHTTRPPRVNDGVAEIDGQDYYFVDKAKMARLAQEQAFIEIKNVSAAVYGTSSQAFFDIVKQGKIPIADVDVQGVAEYHLLCPQLVALFVVPPSFDVWKKRFRQRYNREADFQAAWAKRSQTALTELKFAQGVDYFNWIVNDDLDQTVATVKQLISQRLGIELS